MSKRSTAMAEMPVTHKFSVEAYDRMVEAGILTEDDPVELLRGEVVVMAPIGSRHAAAVNRLNDAFGPLSAQVIRSPQNPIRLDDSEPEPDFALLMRRDDYYADTLPGPADVHLLVEVADTSQYIDREVKAPLYAENGIREYWLVDLAADRIGVYRDPDRERYRNLCTYRRGETIIPGAFPDLEILVDDLLP